MDIIAALASWCLDDAIMGVHPGLHILYVLRAYEKQSHPRLFKQPRCTFYITIYLIVFCNEHMSEYNISLLFNRLLMNIALTGLLYPLLTTLTGSEIVL